MKTRTVGHGFSPDIQTTERTGLQPLRYAPMKLNSKTGWLLRIIAIVLPLWVYESARFEAGRVGALVIAMAYVLWLTLQAKHVESWRFRWLIHLILGEEMILLAYLVLNTIRRNTYDAAVEGPDSIGRHTYLLVVEITDYLWWVALAVITVFLLYFTIRMIRNRKAAGMKASNV